MNKLILGGALFAGGSLYAALAGAGGLAVLCLVSGGTMLGIGLART